MPISQSLFAVPIPSWWNPSWYPLISGREFFLGNFIYSLLLFNWENFTAYRSSYVLMLRVLCGYTNRSLRGNLFGWMIRRIAGRLFASFTSPGSTGSTGTGMETFAWGTVQTFNSCIFWPVVYQGLFVHTPSTTFWRNKPSTWMTHVACNHSDVQLWGHSCIHAQKTGWQSGVRSCMVPALPEHLMQELHVGTVCEKVTTDLAFTSGYLINPRHRPIAAKWPFQFKATKQKRNTKCIRLYQCMD